MVDAGIDGLPVEEEAVLNEEGPVGTSTQYVDEVIERYAARDRKWRLPDEPLRLGSGTVAWRPSLVSQDGSSVAYVQVTDKLRPFIERRLLAASADGLQVHVIVELSCLYNSKTLSVLESIDAVVDVIDDERVDGKSHVLAVMADLGVPVNREVRQSLARSSWARRVAGSAWVRGRRLEALLSFLLSQVVDFRVVERNYRTATEEVDVVIQIDNYSNRCWSDQAMPFLLIEAKNWSDRIDQKEVSAFVAKILTKRNFARLGIMVGTSGFGNDARLQEMLLGAREGTAVALIGPEGIEQWIDSPDPDSYLESKVRHAMLNSAK